MRSTSKKAKAFTLVELMVAMAVIAVLLTLATVGISTLNRLSRENQRRTTLDNILRMVSAYYADNFSYPDAADFIVTANSINIDGYNFPPVPLTAATQIDSETSLNGSLYCYSTNTSDGNYVLGVKLESGQYVNLGESVDKCSDTSSSFYISN